MRALSAILAALAVSCIHAHAGYTHYFTWHQTPTEAALKQCVAEMNLLIEARKNILVSPDAPGSVPASPKVETSHVDFNGVGENAHEPFVFPGENGFNFCKTAAKPYDEVVTACLLVARDHFPSPVLSISSDGSWDDWVEGAKLYASVFGRPAKNPMSEHWIGGVPGGLVAAVFTAVTLIIAAFFWRNRKLGKL